MGPAAGALLGEDDLAVADDVELGLLAADRRRVDASVPELGRETRGPSVVPVSDGAVEDLDAHRKEPIFTASLRVGRLLPGSAGMWASNPMTRGGT